LATSHELLLPLKAILLGGIGGVSSRHQSVLDGADLFEREHRLR
jgi:hypothetical protein